MQSPVSIFDEMTQVYSCLSVSLLLPVVVDDDDDDDDGEVNVLVRS